jgi:TolB protein
MGVIEPMPFAVPDFVAETAERRLCPRDRPLSSRNLSNTGLFREIPASAHIARVTSFDAPCSIPTGARSTPRR